MSKLMFFICLIILSSCSVIYFTEPQPENGKRLSEVPVILQGKWFGKNEGWAINERGVSNINLITDANGTVVDTTYKNSVLSDTFRLYEADGFYIVNSKERCDYWKLVILKPLKNGQIEVYYPEDPNDFSEDSGLSLKEAIYEVNDEEKSFKNLNPKVEGSLEFKSAVFTGEMNNSTLRKIASKDNLMIILNKNGSITNAITTDSPKE